MSLRKKKTKSESREYFKQKMKEWREKNPKRHKEIAIKCYYKNQEDILAKAKIRREALKLETIQHYGGKCNCCGINILEFLSLDHINNDGYIDRGKGLNRKPGGTSFYQKLKKQNWPKGFQVLCYNCNCVKGFYGKCVHPELKVNLVKETAGMCAGLLF